MVLAVDGSASVTYEEFGLIAGGMAAALRDPAVIEGLVGTSILALLLWSGAGQQDVITPWTRIATAADLEVFADGVDNMPRTVRAGATAIGEALLASLTLLASVPAVPKRNLVNVIGDGRSNDGIAPGPIRDRMVAAGLPSTGYAFCMRSRTCWRPTPRRSSAVPGRSPSPAGRMRILPRRCVRS